MRPGATVLGLSVGVLVGACGAPTNTPPRPPEFVAASPSPADVRSASLEVGLPSEHESLATVTPPAPPAPVFVPVAVPFASDAVVVEQVSMDQAVVLFADETVPIREAVADLVVATGDRVVPLDELRSVEAAAAEGRLTLEGDRQCRTPLSGDDVLARYFPTARTAAVRASCIGGCKVAAFVDDRVDPNASATYVSRTVRAPHDPRAWARVRLRPTDVPVITGSVGGVVGGPGAPAVHFSALRFIGPWGPSPSYEPMREVWPQARTCEHPEPRVLLFYEVLATVAPSGEVSRCEAKAEHSMARSQDAQCLCAAVRSARYGRGAAGRRLRFGATDQGQEPPLGVVFEPLQPHTEAWVKRLRDAPVLRTCTDEVRPEPGFEATTVLHLSADGTVDHVEMFGEIDTRVEMLFARCMVAGLRQVPLPCAPPGVDALHVALRAIPRE